MRFSDEQILAALLSAGSSRKAAKSLGCSVGTIRQRLKSPTFAAKYQQEKENLLTGACDLLQSRLTFAIDCLTKIAVDDASPAGVRVAACDSILRHFLRYLEAVELEKRVSKLEGMDGRAGGGSL